MHEEKTIQIIRLLNGECSTIEKNKIGDWLKESEDNRKLYTDLRKIWLAAGVFENKDSYNVESAITKFKDRINIK